MNVEVGIEISVGSPLPDIHYESGRRSRTQQYGNEADIEDLERYENIIDLLDFEDVFEYFDEVESLVEQAVLEGVGLPTNILKRSLSVVGATLEAEITV